MNSRKAIIRGKAPAPNVDSEGENRHQQAWKVSPTKSRSILGVERVEESPYAAEPINDEDTSFGADDVSSNYWWLSKLTILCALLAIAAFPLVPRSNHPMSHWVASLIQRFTAVPTIDNAASESLMERYRELERETPTNTRRLSLRSVNWSTRANGNPIGSATRN